MQREVISTCPVCDSQLRVTRLHCNTCGTTIEGEFNVGRFGRLDLDQLPLLESFLRSRGNLRELERELGVSYPPFVIGLSRCCVHSDSLTARRRSPNHRSIPRSGDRSSNGSPGTS